MTKPKKVGPRMFELLEITERLGPARMPLILKEMSEPRVGASGVDRLCCNAVAVGCMTRTGRPRLFEYAVVDGWRDLIEVVEYHRREASTNRKPQVHARKVSRTGESEKIVAEAMKSQPALTSVWR